MRHGTLPLTLAAVLLFWSASTALGQIIGNIPAGVEVDAAGVLRLRTFADPTGQLTQQRLAQARAALNADVARPSKLRKISLNRLEAAIQASLESGVGISDEMRYLAGLTGITYVFFYPESHDIVLAGPAEGFGLNLAGRVIGLTTGRSVLELQDLVVALRSFSPGSAPTEFIGCSIDPTSEGLQRMQQFLVAIRGRIGPGDAEGIAQGLKESLGPQTITINGVPAQTHYAQVLVEADYRMKLIGIGLEIPPVRIPSYVARANPSSVARNALQRWYFVPDYDAVRISEDGFAMQLVGQGVKLVCENEVVHSDGRRSQTGHTDRASQAFVRAFTQRYAELAQAVPVFAQLRNLIDMAIVAAFLQQQDWYGQAGWTASLLSDEQRFPVATYPAPLRVDSAVNVVWKGNVLMTPIGGGVSIQASRALDSTHLRHEEKGSVSAARESLDLHSLDNDQWWWD
jgi:hypothetical protein